MKSNGQTLIEVLIALAAAVVIISALTVISNTSLNSATTSKNQNLATQYAQEGSEIVRTMRDSDYQTFSSLSGNYCLAQTCSSIVNTNGGPCGKNSVCTQNVGIFIRQVTVRQSDAGCTNNTKVTTSVSWADGKCGTGTFCHRTQVVSCFSNTSGISSP